MERLISLVMLWGFLALPCADASVSAAMHTGELLRMHVIAHDDTAGMQAIKQPVREAVQAAYVAMADPSLTMLENVAQLRPSLEEAAQIAAVEAGFAGEVCVMLGTATFDARVLDGLVIPAGDYPALIVRLGAGRGHNWWGLVDPRTSLLAACVEKAGDEHAIVWDWSPQALWRAICWGLTFHHRGGAA